MNRLRYITIPYHHFENLITTVKRGNFGQVGNFGQLVPLLLKPLLTPYIPLSTYIKPPNDSQIPRLPFKKIRSQIRCAITFYRLLKRLATI